MSLWSDYEGEHDDLLAHLRRNPSYAPTPRQSRLAQDALGTETRYDPSALEVEIGYIVGYDPALHPGSEDTIAIGHRVDGVLHIEHVGSPFTEEPDTYTDYVRRWVDRTIALQAAQRDIALVRVIAANPAYLHHLATAPAWKAYADAHRR